jgi:hypothetical protein
MVKTYILRNGNVLSYPFNVCSGTKRVTFKGSTPYNEKMCGTFQTGDEELQQAMESNPMFNRVYDLWITATPAKKAAVAAPAAAPPGGGSLTRVNVGSWADAKLYMVEQHGVSKFTSNDPEMLAEMALGLGLEFVIAPPDQAAAQP